MRSLRVGGCTFAEDPTRSCAQVLPLWSADVDRRVLHVRCFACDAPGPYVLDVQEYRTSVGVSAGKEHVCLELAGEPLRLDVVEGSVLAGPVRIEAALRLERDIAPQLPSLQRLDRLVKGRDVGLLRDNRLPRLVLALRAFDAGSRGASLRDIASRILATPDWPGDGDYAKSSARRLVSLAATLMRSRPSAILNREI